MRNSRVKENVRAVCTNRIAIAAILAVGCVTLPLVTVTLTEPRPVSGPNVCATQLTITYATDQQMRADERRVRQHDDVASSTSQTQRQSYEWYRAGLADMREPALQRLLNVDVFEPRIWVVADDVDLDELAEALSRDLSKPRKEFAQATPCATDTALARA